MPDKITSDMLKEALQIVREIKLDDQATLKDKLSKKEWVEKLVINKIKDKAELLENQIYLITNPPNFLLSEYLGFSTDKWKTFILNLGSVDQKERNDSDDFKASCEKMAEVIMAFFQGCNKVWQAYDEYKFDYNLANSLCTEVSLKTYIESAIPTALYKVFYVLSNTGSKSYFKLTNWHGMPIPTRVSEKVGLLKTDDDKLRREAKIKAILKQFKTPEDRASKTSSDTDEKIRECEIILNEGWSEVTAKLSASAEFKTENDKMNESILNTYKEIVLIGLIKNIRIAFCGQLDASYTIKAKMIETNLGDFRNECKTCNVDVETPEYDACVAFLLQICNISSVIDLDAIKGQNIMFSDVPERALPAAEVSFDEYSNPSGPIIPRDSHNSKLDFVEWRGDSEDNFFS